MDQIVKAVLDWGLVLKKSALPRRAISELKKLYERPNPKFFKAQAMGFWTGNMSRSVKAWDDDGDFLTLPRTAAGAVREMLENLGMELEVDDDTIDGAEINFKLNGKLRGYQDAAAKEVVSAGSGIVRGPCGSGKTICLLGAIVALRRRAIVVVHNTPLLDQWRGAISDWLGHSPGIIGAGKKKDLNAPIVLAMQQSMARIAKLERRPSWTDGFSVLAGDECFEGTTPVLMADGTLKPIASIQPGDVVAVGGVVRTTMRKPYVGTMLSIGSAIATSNHPFATQRGKIEAGLLDRSDVLWHDPLYERRIWNKDVFDLRKTDPITQPTRVVPETWERTVRSRDGSMQTLRMLCRTEDAWPSFSYQMWNNRPVECRIDQGDRPTDGGDLQLAHGAKTARSGRVYTEEDEGSGDKSTLSRRMVSRTTGSFPTRGRDRFVEGQDVASDGQRIQTVLDRPLPSLEQPCGERGMGGAETVRIRQGAYGQDRGYSKAVPDRFRTPRLDACDRVGRTIASEDSPQADGCPERWIPGIERLDGHPVQCSVRLQPHQADVRTCVGWGMTTVYNLDTEHGMYVASGLLCYNCHHWAASTFQAVGRLFRAKHFIGMSADHRRKDGLEFLIEWTFGPLLYEIKREVLEVGGDLVPRRVYVVPTEYTDPRYLESICADESPDWVSMLNRMMDVRMAPALARARLVWKVVGRIVKDHPGARVLVLNNRVEACKMLVEQFGMMGLNAGLMIGSPDNRAELERTKGGLQSGLVQVGVGTTVADEGLDIPALTHVVMTSPVHQHPKRFEQMVGRAARPWKGKRRAIAVYMWDRLMFPAVPEGDVKRERMEQKVLGKLQDVVEDLRVMDGDIDFVDDDAD